MTLFTIVNDLVDKHDCKVLPHNTYFHQAVIIKRNRILARAHNSIGSRSKGSGYSTNTIHAEKAVVKDLGDISKLRGATLFVYRFNASGQFRNSKPCSECQIFLKKCLELYGLKSYAYSV